MVLLQIQRWFQHTAARRRLVRKQEVQTGSQRFNTQPPEGGWVEEALEREAIKQFQHTAARRRLG